MTLPKYVNGVLETTFCSQVTFGQAERVQNWPSFIRGDSVRSKIKAKFMTKENVNCNMFHITFGFFLCCNNILVSASFGVGNHFLSPKY